MVRVLSQNDHLHVLPFAVSECTKHFPSRRKDRFPALFLRCQKRLHIDFNPHENQKLLEVHLLGLRLNEVAPIPIHSGMELFAPGETALRKRITPPHTGITSFFEGGS